MKIRFWLKTAGYCESHQNFVLRGARRKKITFPGSYGLIQHPEKGWILFDTGYTRRFHEETRSFPGKIYGMITPVSIQAEEEAREAIKAHGISAADIQHIIVSHFHADHIGGLKDFPNASFYCSKRAFEASLAYKGIQAVRRGMLPGHIPEDFKNRVQIINSGSFCSVKHPQLGSLVDLFGDQSILLVDLPGHAAGQVGALLQAEDGEVFLVADAAWVKENYEEEWLPHPIVRLFFDSWTDFRDSLQKVRAYHLAHPENLIIPTHCEATHQQVFKMQNKQP